MTQLPASDHQSDRLTPGARRAVTAAFLGWTMDAFDYFVVVLVYADVGDRLRRLAHPDGVPDDGDVVDAPDRCRGLRRVG